MINTTNLGGDVIFLDNGSYKLFNLLKKGSLDPTNALSLAQIKSKLNLRSEKQASELVNDLNRIDGIFINSETHGIGDNKKTTFSISPETLNTSVRKEISKGVLKDRERSNISYGAVYLAEPCFATKAQSDNATKGLALFLETNNLSSHIQEVIIQGGVIPHVPPFNSKSYTNDLRFLGHIDRKFDEGKGLAEGWLEDKIGTIWEREFYKEHINNSKRKKITKPTEAFEVAGQQLGCLMNTLPHASLRIQAGEEDRKNIGHLEETLIKRFAEEKSEKIDKETEQNYTRINLINENIFFSTLEREVFKDIKLKNSLRKKPEEKKEDYRGRMINKIIKEKTEELHPLFEELCNIQVGTKETLFNRLYGKTLASQFNLSIDNIVNYSLWAESNNPDPKAFREKIKYKINKINKDLGTKEGLKNDLESKLEDLREFSSWTDLLLGSGWRSAVTQFTRQYPVFADELEFAFKRAKDTYTKHFFSWNIPQTPIVHISGRKNILVKSETIEDIKTGKPLEVGGEYELIQDEKTGKRILLIHNIGHLSSDSVTPRAIRDAKLELNYRNTVLNKIVDENLKDSQPDIILLGGHCAGGFEVMPWFKHTEHMIEGEFVKGQELSYMIQLPTLQSIKKLDWLKSHNFKNWHTKQNDRGYPYASAATIHFEDNEEVNSFWTIDTDQLEHFGVISDEIKEYRKELRKKDLTPETRKELLNLIKKRKEQVRVDFNKIEAAGDFHLGTTDHLERYSKDQLIKASQIYQIRNGFPDIVCYDEILHGTESRVFEGAARYEAKPPVEFEQRVINQIDKMDGLTDSQKYELLKKESMRNQRALTIHNVSEQKNIFQRLVKEAYLDELIEWGSKVIFTSGNHYNKSQRTGDEALELALQFPSKLRDNGQVLAFSGKGNDFGVGAIRLEDGRVLFVMHRFPTRQNEIYGIAAHLRNMNNDADIVIAGDRHQPGIGYADKHAIILHPGMEPINKYVPVIGKPAGVRGFINLGYVPAKPQIFKFDFVVNPTLEKIIEQENVI